MSTPNDPAALRTIFRSLLEKERYTEAIAFAETRAEYPWVSMDHASLEDQKQIHYLWLAAVHRSSDPGNAIEFNVRNQGVCTRLLEVMKRVGLLTPQTLILPMKNSIPETPLLFLVRRNANHWALRRIMSMFPDWVTSDRSSFWHSGNRSLLVHGAFNFAEIAWLIDVAPANVLRSTVHTGMYDFFGQHTISEENLPLLYFVLESNRSPHVFAAMFQRLAEIEPRRSVVKRMDEFCSMSVPCVFTAQNIQSVITAGYRPTESWILPAAVEFAKRVKDFMTVEYPTTIQCALVWIPSVLSRLVYEYIY